MTFYDLDMVCLSKFHVMEAQSNAVTLRGSGTLKRWGLAGGNKAMGGSPSEGINTCLSGVG
jgi:hypothetical protein